MKTYRVWILTPSERAGEDREPFPKLVTAANALEAERIGGAKDMTDKLNVKLINSTIQATRREPAKEVNFWLLSLPNGDSVSCKTIEEARECAARFGKEILL